MSLLSELRKRGVFVTCPACTESFPASKGTFFDATKRLPGDAATKLEELRMAVKDDRREHVEYVRRMKERSKKGAVAVNVGKVVEKIAPSLEGFPASPGDCRSLFEPIDYVVFRGLALRGVIEAVAFVDVKSGRAQTTPRQRDIRRVVESGKVSLYLTPKEPES